MGTKKKLRYSLVMEYNEEEDQLEFIEERLEPIGESVKRIKIENLTMEELMLYFETTEDIAIA